MSEDPQADDTEIRELDDEDLDEVSAGANGVEVNPANNPG